MNNCLSIYQTSEIASLKYYSFIQERNIYNPFQRRKAPAKPHKINFQAKLNFSVFRLLNTWIFAYFNVKFFIIRFCSFVSEEKNFEGFIHLCSLSTKPIYFVLIYRSIPAVPFLRGLVGRLLTFIQSATFHRLGPLSSKNSGFVTGGELYLNFYLLFMTTSIL